MAIYNEILSARFARMLQKLFSMKGPTAVRQLAGEVTSTVSFKSGVETRWLEGWFRYAVAVAPGPVAAQTNAMQFRNPVNSKVIAVIEKITMAQETSAGLALFSQGFGAGDLASTTAGQRIDGRQAVAGTMGSVIVVSSSAASISGIAATNYQYELPNATNVSAVDDEDHQWVLSPGDSLRIVFNVANSISRVSAIWRERPMEESELQ